MADDSGNLADKLADYLDTLPCHTLAQLVHELDLATITRDLNAANSLILNSSRAALVRQGTWAEVVAHPERLAFAEAEPFLIRVHTERKHRGRIAAESLRGIWIALVRADAQDRVPAIVRAHARAVCSDPVMLTSGRDDMRAELLDRLRALYAEVAGNGAAHIGGQRAVEDLADLIAVMTYAGRLAKFSAFLDASPQHLERFTASAREAVVEALAPFAREEMVYPLLLLLRRMKAPGALVSLLVETEGTDDPAALERARFAPVVEVLLNELDVLARSVADTLPAGDMVAVVIPAMRRFHEIASGLTFAIDMEVRSGWAQRLSSKRSRIADSLRAPLEKAIATLRLGITPSGAGFLAPDPIDTAQAIAVAHLLTAIRPLRSELALNECVTRVYAAAESFFDTAARTLPQQARDADPGDMPALHARFDALYRASMILFGDDYAALLRRSGNVAGLQLAETGISAAA